jgi:5-bromo-4-chloroindolyl phosphate hydrolysis protein
MNIKVDLTKEEYDYLRNNLLKGHKNGYEFNR